MAAAATLFNRRHKHLLLTIASIFVAAALWEPLLASAFATDCGRGQQHIKSTPSIARCVAYSSVEFISDVAEPVPCTTCTFFEEQLDICRQIVVDHFDDNRFSDDVVLEGEAIVRSRFREHPRCTARFGEVLLHAKNTAATSEERQNAIQNAMSIVKYVETCLEQSNNSQFIREGLIADIAAALTSQSLREFRVKQIEAGITPASHLDEDNPDLRDSTKAKHDFAPEHADLEIMGRLYYSSIQRNLNTLREVGLTLDHGGFTALLALCRAASRSHLIEGYAASIPTSTLHRDGATLDAALADHFNGITAPGCRFLFSPKHGIHKANNVRGRSRRLVVAFSSLGNGLVRHEFGGSLAKINKLLQADAREDSVFDVLFVADPSQSWYQKDSRGHFNGFAEYEQRIRAAAKPYDKVSLVGDSMGGSASLLFSHLATESVVAFSPQVDLAGDVHVSRYDMTFDIRDRFCERLLQSVEEASSSKPNIFVHRGVEEADIRHTDKLAGHFSRKHSEYDDKSLDRQVKIVEHTDCLHHQVAVHLKQKGQLSKILHNNLISGRQ